MTALVAVLALAGAGYAFKVKQDEQERRELAAQERAQERAEERERAAEEAERKAEAEAAAERYERRQRASLIRQMQASITKDAKKQVEEGVLEGPIYYTSCDPLGGGSVDDLTALTTTFECLAVNEKLGGGRVRGWVFSATANWDKQSWSWSLGD